MRYLLTWVEGNEVCYRFVGSKNDIDTALYEGRNLIVTPLDE